MGAATWIEFWLPLQESDRHSPLERMLRTPLRMGPELIAPDAFRDALAVDPKHYRLDLENDRVRVLRLSLQGDEAVPVHDDRAGLLVCVNKCHLRFTRPDGRVQDIHLQAGETRWVSEDTRSAKNLSPAPMEMLYIEMKTACRE